MNHVNEFSCKADMFSHNRGKLILSIIGIGFKVIAGLGFSAFTQRILDTISCEANYTVLSLLTFAFFCILCLIIAALLEYFFWTGFMSQSLEQYREHTYRKMLCKHASAFNQESMDTYISTLSIDLGNILSNYIEMMPYAIEIILSFIGTVALMLYYNLRLAAVAFLLSLLPLIFSLCMMKEVERSEVALSDANGIFLSAFAEVIRGFQTIKSLKAESQIAYKLSISNQYASNSFSHREHVEISVAYIASLVGHASQVAFFFVGMYLAKRGADVSAGTVVMFIELMQNITQLGISMPEIIAKIRSAQKLIDKNDSLLRTNSMTGEIFPLTCKENIVLHKLAYCYDNSEGGLDSISCTIPARGCYAIIGESGSGKSTLLNLLAGINTNYTGDIQFDNTEIKTISYNCITELISVVNQDVFIFDASIKDNITLFGLFDETLIELAIKKACLKDMVKEKGLEYRCGDNGNALSGGERQRIGIARSIMQGTDVLLMDEVTSALDTQTGYQIIETIQKMDGKTRIIVTHDLYPMLLKNFDSIFVLKNGKLVEQGKYDDLMTKKGVCYKLVNKQ